MSRPSQCVACGCFEACLFPGTQGCAEDAEAVQAAARYQKRQHAAYTQAHKPRGRTTADRARRFAMTDKETGDSDE